MSILPNWDSSLEANTKRLPSSVIANANQPPGTSHIDLFMILPATFSIAATANACLNAISFPPTIFNHR